MANTDPTLEHATTANSGASIHSDPLPTSLPGPDPPSLSVFYTQLTTYPFHTDAEFLAGLATILGHPSVPATPNELRSNPDLVLQARCFYLSRRFNIDPPIDPVKYLEWSKDRAGAAKEGENAQGPVSRGTGGEGVQTSPSSSATTITAAAPSSTITTPPPPSANEPTYPPSFAAIIDLITKNLPIPGIEEVPPTVLEPGTSKVDHTPRRKKPWEKEETSISTGEGEQVQAAEAAGAQDGASGIGEQEASHDTKDSGINGNGNAVPNEGVVKILQPTAIPPSGLLSGD
ncbi:hypothetical protein H2200_010677 [Cladophialophora chaetospira]|uniref:Uncharacterized protein n=1 Tax=Cladophialophora chaetospira TaxID=386627 RepID=A0AA39CDT1_9EURO|nr:hypothetical protein H2200_010677 [Cladophialophora chaetospira]